MKTLGVLLGIFFLSISSNGQCKNDTPPSQLIDNDSRYHHGDDHRNHDHENDDRGDRHDDNEHRDEDDRHDDDDEHRDRDGDRRWYNRYRK